MFSAFLVKELGHLQDKVKKKSPSYQREDCVLLCTYYGQSVIRCWYLLGRFETLDLHHSLQPGAVLKGKRKAQLRIVSCQYYDGSEGEPSGTDPLIRVADLSGTASPLRLN